jgi:hypothetical protein
MMEKEKSIMGKIVELVEQKNQLVEQLESLRLMEREEDTVVTRIFSGKVNSADNSTNEIIDKYEPFKDII